MPNDLQLIQCVVGIDPLSQVSGRTCGQQASGKRFDLNILLHNGFSGSVIS
jgi:hypothetical protein